MLLNFFGRMVLKRLNKCFRDLFFGTGDAFFNLRVFVKSVKYLFKVCDIFLLSLIILLFSRRMTVLAVLFLLEHRGLTVFQNFLVSVILLEFKLLKYCCFVFFRAFVHLFLLLSIVLKIYAIARFIEFITQFRPYHSFFS